LAPKTKSAELYKLCTSTEHTELEKGFQTLGGILFRAARKQLNAKQFDNAFVKDCVQDALETIWKKIDTDNGPDSPGAFVGWSCQIVKNKCIDEVRKVQRRKTDSLDGNKQDEEGSENNIVDKGSPNPAAETIRKDIALHLTDAIENFSLSKNEKAVLVGGYLDGKTDKELSVVLDTTDSNIKVIRHRALKKLRNNDDLLTLLRRLL